MEQDPSSARTQTGHARPMKKRLAVAATSILIGLVFVLPASGATHGGKDVHKTAQDYISEFQRGIAFNANAPVDTLVTSHRIDKAGLSTLARELASGGPAVRENIVRLLEKVGLELDTPAPDKFAVIRDHAIIKVLLVEGLAKDDVGADAAVNVLRQHCMPKDLAAFADIYLKSLSHQQGDYLTLTAKAKVVRALPYVQKLAALPDWRENEQDMQIVKIALAALGDKAVEDSYIKSVWDAEKNAPPAPKNRFYDVGAAKDGSELANHLAVLGYVGTQRSLLTACSYLRSPLKSYVPDVSEQSIRYAALDAVFYNYPDEKVLYRPVKQSEWAAAEQFCTKHFGAVFDGPTPDLPTDEVYPRMQPAPNAAR
jgi:hypothetical protein